jgi:DNA-binding transcriptional MerR regulator
VFIDRVTPSQPPRPDPGLTIGDVAQLAGITPRAIRHYHAMGLLPEPARDPSGYRRYDAESVVAVVRVARLRAVGMPIAQIAEQAGSLAGSLTALAAELDAEIDRLTTLLDRIHELVRSGAHEPPDAALLQALHRHGRLAADVRLDPAEVAAAELVDALHPQGMAGLLDQAHDLLADPGLGARIGPLLQRFRALDESTSSADLDRLADEVAAAFPRPPGAAPTVDVDLMDKLLGARMTAVQRGFLRRLRTRMDAGSTDV